MVKRNIRPTVQYWTAKRILKRTTRIGLLVLQKHILKRLNALQLLELLKLILKKTNTASATIDTAKTHTQDKPLQCTINGTSNTHTKEKHSSLTHTIRQIHFLHYYNSSYIDSANYSFKFQIKK